MAELGGVLVVVLLGSAGVVLARLGEAREASDAETIAANIAIIDET